MEKIEAKTTVKRLRMSHIDELLKKNNLLEFNRNININHAIMLGKSAAERGILRMPLIADVSAFDKRRQYVIADAQHFCKGISLLKGPMRPSSLACLVKEYKSKEELISDIAMLNTTASSWKDDDFLNAWYRYGSDNTLHFKNYAHLFTMRENILTELSPGLTIDIYTSDKKAFKNGRLSFRDRGFSDNLAVILNDLKKDGVFNGANSLLGILQWTLARYSSNKPIDLNKLDQRIRSAVRIGEISKKEGRDSMIDLVEVVYNRI